MKPLPVVLLALAGLVFVLAENAEAADQRVLKGCSSISWFLTGSRAITLEHANTAPTCDQPPPVNVAAAIQLAAGSCHTVGIRHQADPTGPTTPTGVNIYMMYENENFDHGVDGTQGWDSFLRKYPLGQLPTGTTTIQVCATSDGTPTGTPRIGTFRLTIRACAYVAPTGDGCQGQGGSNRIYDVNSDNGGQPGSGILGNAFAGVWRSGASLSCFQDSTSLGGPDVATYVSGDIPRFRICTPLPYRNLGHETYRVSTIPQSGGSPIASVLTPAASTGTLDTSLSRITLADGYATLTSPTKRLDLADQMSQVLGSLPWTFWTAAPPGATLTSETQLDAAWGLVDKSLTTTCTLHDPVQGTLGSGIVLNRGEQVQCRQTTLKNAREEDLPSGTILRVTARRASEPPLSTADAPACDGTTTAAGTWTCDLTLRTTATVTTGLAYGVDVGTYTDTTRTTLLARATVAGLLDVSSTVLIAGASPCQHGPVSSEVVWMMAEPASLSWRVCNVRAQPISPTLTAQLVREDTGAPDNGPTILTPSGGTYAWAPVMTGGRAHTPTGLPKTLTVSDGTGNSGSYAAALNVSDLLTLPPPHTWLKACLGPEQSVYVVAADIICANEGPVANARGAVWTQPLTFWRWINDTETGSQLSPSTVSGITTGTSPNHQESPQPPAGDTWRFEAHVADEAGNYGDASRGLTFISPYTGPLGISVLGTETPTPPGATFRALIQVQKRDPATGIMQPYTPDAPPSWRILSTDGASVQLVIVPTTQGIPNPQTPVSWWATWIVPQDWPPGRPALLQVEANVSGAAIHEEYPLLIQEETGGDPLSVSAAYSWDTHRVTLAIHASYLNGTGRSGIAEDLVVRLYSPTGEERSISVTLTEAGAPGTYHAAPYLGLAPQLGAWSVTVDAPQPRGDARASASTAFLVPMNLTLLFLDQRDLVLDLWGAQNASFRATWDLINTSRAENNASFAYTWDLINQTLMGLEVLDDGPPDVLAINFTGDGPLLIYADRPARLEGAHVEDGARYRPWYWTWDYGDKTTGEGPVTYHAWTKPGTYNVTARATTSLGSTNTTNITVEVRLSTPIVNITGPQQLKLGETGTWTIGPSHDPYDDVAFTFVSDPRTVRVWLLGERWAHSGYCGPLNATSLQAPDEVGFQIPFLQAQWDLHRADTCTSFKTAWTMPGEHHVVLSAVNKHGVVSTLDYTVLVGDVRARLAPPPRSGGPIVEPVDFGPVVTDTRETINDFLGFLQWLMGG